MARKNTETTAGAKLGLEDLKKDVKIDHHKIPLHQFEKRFETNLTSGLTNQKAAKLLTKYGRNELTPPPKPSKIWEFIKVLCGGFNMLLWAGCIACFVSYVIEANTNEYVRPDNLYIGSIIGSVCFITSCYQFYQSNKASSIMDSFKKMVPHKALVIREGNKFEINAAEVVPGDLIEISSGSRLAGDVRVIESNGFRVDNSSLTGECEPQGRTKEFTNDNPLESKNVALFSTNVVEGTAKAVVMLTGDQTIMGRIVALSTQVANGKTPIAQDLHHFLKIISFVATAKGVIFFTILMCLDTSLLDAFIFAIAIIVATVPEGITVTVTVCLTLTAKEMARKSCLVKQMDAVETLGSTSTICSDKTGTLTQNKMTISHVYFNEIVHDSTPHSPKVKDLETSSLFRSATLCSRAFFKGGQEKVDLKDRDAIGDASEVAILRFCTMMDSDLVGIKKQYPKVCEIPFNSSNKYQLSIHRKVNGAFLLVIKGAPERIYGMCENMIVKDSMIKIEKKNTDKFELAYAKLGGLGERVLGFGEYELPAEQFPQSFVFNTEDINFPMEKFTFCGLMSMIDPPRPGVPEAVALCTDAGIRVAMITGDHQETARAIASQVNIVDSIHDCRMIVENCDLDNFDFKALVELGNKFPSNVEKSASLRTIEEKPRAIVIHGDQLRRMGQNQLDEIVKFYNQIVFARTSPAQKLQIVEAYQRQGNIVAVTGDGVNDAPALKKADIGIAMGIAGTDVSKQAADMILLNDNFASIVTGVKEGRRIFDNLKKSIAYTLTSKIPETTPFILHCVLGIPLPLSVIGIFAIDLGTDLWPAISLAYEPAESDIMLRPPRNLKYNKLVNATLIRFAYLQIGMIQGLAAFSTYFVIMADNGWFPADLLGIRGKWTDENIQILTDSYGQEWTYQARKELLGCCHGAFFYAIVVVQWADLLVSKTRTHSIFTHGISNQVLNAGLFFTVFLTILLLYTPGVNTIFAFNPITLKWALVAVPFAWVIFIYDETRKYLIRKNPTGFLYRETYY